MVRRANVSLSWFHRQMSHLRPAGRTLTRDQGYLGEAMMLFERYMTTSEYNSPTYAGVTLMALGVSQYLPHDSPVRIKGAMMIREIWREIGKDVAQTGHIGAGPQSPQPLTRTQG